MNETQKQRFADALARLSDDTELLCSMASLVIADADEVVARLRLAVEQGRCEEAARSAHQLKGMLSTFETGSPVIELQELIDAARAGDAATTREQHQLLQQDVQQLLNEIQNLQPTG